MSDNQAVDNKIYEHETYGHEAYGHEAYKDETCGHETCGYAGQPITSDSDLSLIEDTPIMVVRWTFPKDTYKIVFKSVSQNISNLGYSSEELLSNAIDWISLVHPDDMARVQETITKAIDSNANSYINHFRFKTKNGEYRWLEEHAKIIQDPEGRVRYFQGVLIDITERKEVELELSRKNAYSQLLHETSVAITNRFDIKELTESFAKQLAKLFNCENVVLLVVNEKTKTLDDFAKTGKYINDKRKSVAFGEGAVGQAWAKAQAIYVEDYQNYNQALKNPVFTMKSFTAVPLLVSGKVLGVMGLGFETQKKFDGFTKEYLTKYAQLVAIALDNAQLYKSAELKIKEKEKVQQEYRNLFLEAQQGSQELLLLDEIQNTISGQLDLQSLYQLIIKKVSEIFDYSHANFGVFEGDFLTVKASYGYVDESFADKLPTSYKPVEYVLKHQQALLIPCKDSPLDLTENQKKLFKSVLLMPIILSDKVYGILTVASNTKTLSYKDVGLLKKVRELLVVAIENAQLHEQVKKELIRNESLFKISRSVQESNQLETLMDDIAEQIRRAVSARWSVIYKIDLSKAYIEHVSTTNHNNDSLPPFSFEQLQNGSTGFAIENKEVVLGQKDTDYGKTAATLQKRNNIGSFIVAPLIYRSKVIGILQVLNSLDDANFYQEDVALLTTVANQAGVALAQYDLRQKIEHQAYHDALTDLPNRLLFEDALTTTLADAKENNKMFAAMFLDLDGFKHVNDTLGHDVGDKLLQIVAKRLTSRTRQTDILARMGGDEFAIILNNLPSKDEAIRIGQSYLSLFQDVFKIDNHTVRVGTSIGISFYPNDASDAGSLLRHADSAMYQAKDSGKNSVCSFTPALAEKAKERVELEAELRKAVKEGGLELYYQPQLSCLTNECIGVEALLRWNHPELGFISPAKFIPIAEESKLILDIGTWVLHKACRQSVEWQNILAQTTSDKAIKMAVNISAIQFGSTDFIETIVSALNESSLDPELLEIEVTESVVMKDVSMIIDRLEALRSIGITVAIDDFGTGYSSLQYLQKLPLDKLKIDRSFINEITDGSSAPIASSILALAKSLNLKTVAEGIETEDQLEFLRMLGCDEAQGFYFAKPMPASKFWEWYTKTENSQLTKQVVSI